jgi:hypothetical protein
MPGQDNRDRKARTVQPEGQPEQGGGRSVSPILGMCVHYTWPLSLSPFLNFVLCLSSTVSSDVFPSVFPLCFSPSVSLPLFLPLCLSLFPLSLPISASTPLSLPFCLFPLSLPLCLSPLSLPLCPLLLSLSLSRCLSPSHLRCHSLFVTLPAISSTLLSTFVSPPPILPLFFPLSLSMSSPQCAFFLVSSPVCLLLCLSLLPPLYLLPFSFPSVSLVLTSPYLSATSKLCLPSLLPCLFPSVSFPSASLLMSLPPCPFRSVCSPMSLYLWFSPSDFVLQ